MGIHVGLLSLLLISGWTSYAESESLTCKGIEDESSFTAMRIVYEILEFFSQDHPKGLPGVVISDPLNFPLEYQFTTSLSVSDFTLHGLSQLQLQSVFLNFSDFRVHMEAKVPELILLGEYLWRATVPWNSDSSGTTDVTISEVEMILDSRISVDSEGGLQTNRDEMQLQLTYGKMSAEFQNLSSVYAVVARVAFPAFVPDILDWVEVWLQETLKQPIKSAGLGLDFPDSISRLDFLMTQVRAYIREVGFDPWPLSSLWVELSTGFYILCENITLEGLSTLHPTQQNQVKYIDNTFQLLLQMGTQELKATGRCGIPYIPLLESPLEVHLEFIRTTVEVHQRTHMRSPPTLRILEIDIGNIEARSSSLGSLDYLTEAAANVIPNLLRRNVEEKLEPLMWKFVQRHLNSLDMKAVLLDQLIKKQKETDRATCNN